MTKKSIWRYVREIHSTAHRPVILSEGRSPKSKFCASKIAVGGIKAVFRSG